MATNNHCSVFIGNIAYQASEADIKRVCEEIGPVVSLKLMTETDGKRKGFGFCEYLDEETALSALRNLNGVEVRGRTLKVSFADKGNNNGKKQGSNLGKNLEKQDEDPLTLFLGKYTSDQLIEIVSEMNELGAKNVQEAQRLLKLCPGLPKAIVQAQLKLGIVPPHVIHVANIKLGSQSVPQSYAQSRILDQGKFADAVKIDSSFGNQPISQIQATQNTVSACKRVFDSGIGDGSNSISHPAKRPRVKEEVVDSGFDGGSNLIAQPSKLLKVKEEAFDSGFSHPFEPLRVKEEERSEPAEPEVLLSPELLKVLLEKQMLRLLAEKTLPVVHTNSTPWPTSP